jgi:hypothetical protein
MQRLISILVTLIVLLGLSYGLAYYTHSKFFDYSFFVGLAVTLIILFFTSKGGYASRNLDMTVQGTSGIKMEHQKFEFSPNLAFITSLAYTVITFVAMLYQYRSYL